MKQTALNFKIERNLNIVKLVNESKSARQKAMHGFDIISLEEIH
jgi:hypothetical protein